MIKMFLVFVFVYLIFHFGIQVLNNLSNLEKWSLTKNAGYATLCSVLAIGLLSLIVFIF